MKTQTSENPLAANLHVCASCVQSSYTCPTLLSSVPFRTHLPPAKAQTDNSNSKHNLPGTPTCT